MVADDDSLVCVGTIDDPNDVPDWFDMCIHKIGQNKSSTCYRSSAVCCVQSARPPVSTDQLSRYTMAV
jgi:hypothetical protein